MTPNVPQGCGCTSQLPRGWHVFPEYVICSLLFSHGTAKKGSSRDLHHQEHPSLGKDSSAQTPGAGTWHSKPTSHGETASDGRALPHARLLHPEVPISPSSLLEKLLEPGQGGRRAPQRMG